jgi:hypothetical protein
VRSGPPARTRLVRAFWPKRIGLAGPGSKRVALVLTRGGRQLLLRLRVARIVITATIAGRATATDRVALILRRR